ncbi:serine/threonine-protein kinase Nek3 isoform X2 [Esox lucius]|nr:serine/threonine-protein kinase Nek3 isoform X2 [Esox lucius]
MDGYTVHNVVGEGSFGRALLVQSRSNQETYVMKEIRLPKTQSKMENARREAVLLSRMKHPNIVSFKASFEGDGHLYIVMEFCVGGDLLQRILQQKNKHFPQDTVLKWFAQMCSGTKHIHDKRVLHRDLKSKNIFLSDKGTVKLGDFGSACVLNSAKVYAHTYVGTPYYVSPEIWDNQPYNNKSDVWSLGCVLYELCTLQHPFQAPSWKSLIMKVCRGSYPPLPPHLPYELQYLIKQMFKTNPRDRPSIHTILTSHRVARLLQSHLANQELQEERRTGRWRIEEGEKVASMLGQKTLMTASTMEDPGLVSREALCEDSRRKQWVPGPSNTALQVLANADLLTSGSLAPTHPEVSDEDPPGKTRGRRQWDRSPPERLLSLLQKAQLSTAFRTYSIHRHGEDPLVGPLSPRGGDSTDGRMEVEEDMTVDEDRLEPRSDDEDTDFEEDSPCDWMKELEQMSTDQVT